MSYANLHDRLLENEWYMGLPDSLGRTFLHLIAYASREDGDIFSHDTAFIAQRIGREKRWIDALLVISGGRIVKTDTGYRFRDWEQWNSKRDVSTDRVRKYRLEKRVSSVSLKQLHETSETLSLRQDKIRKEKQQQGSVSLKQLHETSETPPVPAAAVVNLLSNLVQSKTVNGRSAAASDLEPHRPFAQKCVRILVRDCGISEKSSVALENVIALQSVKLGEQTVDDWLGKKSFIDKDDPVGYIIGSLYKMAQES